MFDDFINELGSELIEIPQEIGTEAIAQVKGNSKSNQKSSSNNNSNSGNQNPMSDEERQKFIRQLYGLEETKNVPLAQLPDNQLRQIKDQRDARVRNKYQEIQQQIQEFRAKKQQEVSKQEAAAQKGTKSVNTQEEKMELWQKQQKEIEKKKKEEEAARMPGSNQSRSGEQGVVMG